MNRPLLHKLCTGVFAIIISSIASGAEYRRILPAMPLSLDPPHLEDINAEGIMIQVSEGLVSMAGDQVVPAVAEKWEFSPDQREITFHIRTNARFSDGAFITSDDVMASLQHALTAIPAEFRFSTPMTWMNLSLRCSVHFRSSLIAS